MAGFAPHCRFRRLSFLDLVESLDFRGNSACARFLPPPGSMGAVFCAADVKRRPRLLPCLAGESSRFRRLSVSSGGTVSGPGTAGSMAVRGPEANMRLKMSESNAAGHADREGQAEARGKWEKQQG